MLRIAPPALRGWALRPLQLQLRLEPMLLVTAGLLPLREPYLVGPLGNQFLRRGRCLRLGRTDHGSGGSRNGRGFDKAPGA